MKEETRSDLLQLVMTSENAPEIMLVEIAQIKAGANRRSLNVEVVEELARSINEVGLLNPITLSKDYKLISGAHRKAAYELLGRDKIPARILDLSDLASELAELEENSCRAELNVLEKSENLLRRKEIYEELHPETRPGGNRRTEVDKEVETANVPRFTESENKKTGESERTIQRLIQIAKEVCREARDLLRTTPIADSQKELLALSKLSESEQVRVATEINSGNARMVEEASSKLKMREESKEQPGRKNDEKRLKVDEVRKGLQDQNNDTVSLEESNDEDEQELSPPEESTPPIRVPITKVRKEKSGKHVEKTTSTFTTPKQRSVLDELVERTGARAELQTGEQFMVFLPRDSSVLAKDLPRNLHLVEVAESSIEQVESEEGVSAGILLLKLRMSKEMSDAFPNVSLLIDDGYLSFRVGQSHDGPLESKTENPKEGIMDKV